MPAPAAPVLNPGFMVLHGNRLEDLRDLLTQFLTAQPLAPLQPEVILVQSNGMKHWLELALADTDAQGICAATRIELPSAYLWQVYRSVLGEQAVPLQMPFDKSALLWRLVRLLPDLAASNPVYAPLQRYLSGHADGRKLYQLAWQIADVLDGYQSYRADWLTDWANGEPGQDVLRGPNGQTQPLEEAHAWQAQLWRDIRADISPTQVDASRASVHAKFMTRMQKTITGQRLGALPQRLVVFGISSLPLQTVQALAVLGEFCQVLLLVQNPCTYYWGDIVSSHDLLRSQLRRRQSVKPVLASTALHSASHPLLASWGKQGRDYLHLLDEFDRVERYAQRFARVDLFVDPLQDSAKPSVLSQLQSSIFRLQGIPDKHEALSKDDSMSFISTHSVQRELEVLHDRLLAWFDADATLQARDVMVMVPDMAAFAPHIAAVFGRFSRGEARYIAHSMADTTVRQSPLVQALELLLRLPDTRVTLADWLGLFEVSAVRQRFALSPADVAQLHAWLNLAGVRWGLDAGHRTAWGVPAGVGGAEQNTWAFGLKRLILGYAVGAGGAWSGVFPQAALNSLDAALMGAVLDWLDAIEVTLRELSSEQTPEQWGQTLHALMARFFKAGDEADERLIQRCLAPLEPWLQACAAARLDSVLPLEVVREHWLSQIEESSLQQRFFGGGVQFGTLMPMRAIPFKVICLLGMNDGDYPRQQAPRDFDLMALNMRAGDRSRREDDRYLFLEALLSAREKLYISWQGNSATDNAEQPPSVLVAQLLDYVQLHWGTAIQAQKQPLQAFSSAYFLHDSPFQTYADDWARVHQQSPAAATDAVSQATVSCAPPTHLSLDNLRQLLRQPVEVFFKARLQVWFDALPEQTCTEEPFSLNSLSQYTLGQTLLDAPDLPRAAEQLRLSGALPLAAFGVRESARLQDKAHTVRERQNPWLQHYPHTLPARSIALEIGGIRLTGVLQGLRCTNEHNRFLLLNQRVGPVRDGNTARIHTVVGLWVQHLAACASAIPLTSVQLGLDGQVVFQPLGAPEAACVLQRLLLAYQAAWMRPLPLACKTAWAYLQAQRQGQSDPHRTAQAIFEGGFQRLGERDESAYLARAFTSYDEIAADLPGWAEQLYGDLATHLQLTAQEGALQ